MEGSIGERTFYPERPRFGGKWHKDERGLRAARGGGIRALGRRGALLASALLAVLAVGALGSAAGCKKKPNEIVLGSFLPLSGSDSTFGSDAKKGIELAVDEANAGGGIHGKKVRMVYEDDHSLPSEAKVKVKELIEQSQVLAIVGEIASDRTIAGGEIANQKGVPIIAPASTALEVTKSEFVFRSCYTDAQQGAVAARFAREAMNRTKAAILFMDDDSYSKGLAKSFRSNYESLGGAVVAERAYRRSEKDLGPYLAELKSQSPQIYFVPVYYRDMAHIAQQAKMQGIPSDAFLGGDGWDSSELLESAGAELEGSHFTNHFAPDVPWDLAKRFMSAYEAKFGSPPPALAAQGYDAARVLLDAVSRAPRDGTPLAIRDAIAKTSNFEGTTGVLTIDGDHNSNKPVVVVQIKNKKFTYVTQMLSL